MGVGRLVMIKNLLLLPVRDNESQPFQDSVWIELELRCADLGGWQRQADVEGGWVHLGRVYREPSRQYVVALTNWLDSRHGWRSCFGRASPSGRRRST